jgi:hypothetical protein
MSIIKLVKMLKNTPRSFFITNLFLFTAFALHGQSSLLNKEIDLDKTSGTIEEMLSEISTKGGFTFSYGNQIKLTKQVKVQRGKQSLKAHLDDIFFNENVTYVEANNKILISYDDIKQEKQKVIISGHVKDANTGEVMIGAAVWIKELSMGTTTNAYGFYSITLPVGIRVIRYSFVGYESVSIEQDLKNNKTINIELAFFPNQLDEITIAAEVGRDNILSSEAGTHNLRMNTVKKIPALAGEIDLLRAIQLLPGVKNSGEASTNFSVRGGNLDQNLILLDEAPVYNPSHLLGIFSVFNADAINDMQLYKGGIPAEYGGRLSSVLDIRMKDGKAKKVGITGGIGMLSSRLTIEGPLKKESSSFIVSGRYTYSDVVTQSVKIFREYGGRLYFYDFNAKINHAFNARNKLFISGYSGQDVSKLGALGKVGWRNTTGTARWNHVFTDNLFSNFSFVYSNYTYALKVGQFTPLQWKSGIEDFSMKYDFTFYATPSATVKFGISSTRHDINPGESENTGAGYARTQVPVGSSLEHAAYVTSEQELNDKFLLSYGLRYSVFQNLGATKVYQYNQQHQLVDSVFYPRGKVYHTTGGLEPRLAIRYLLSETSSLKLNYNRTLQYLQLLSNSSLGLSAFDIWFPSGPNLKPQKADQVAIGYFKNFSDNKFEASVELYHKWLYNQIDFVDHARLLFNPYLEGELRTGKGNAYGVEFFARKNTGKVTGWFSYTYSKTRKEISGINSGNPYNANYDQPHSISLVGELPLSGRWSLSGNWVYSTGRPLTLSLESYDYGDYSVPVYSAERNQFRLPDYHRLDLAFTLAGREKPGKRFNGHWVFSIYNVYFRKNPLLIVISPPVGDSANPNKLTAHRLTLLGLIPSVTYNFKF